LVVLKHLRHDIPLDKISNVKAFFKPHEFIILKQSWQAFSGFPRPGWTALFAGNRYLIFQGTSRKINPINRANIPTGRHSPMLKSKPFLGVFKN
jgi:hypothetical protein